MKKIIHNLLSCCFVFLVLLSMLLAFPVQAAVICPGEYDGHLQGITVDENGAIYWSFTVALVKTDAAGKMLEKINVATHHGDLCHVEGKVYVAVNLGKFNQEPGHADSWVYVYDAKDLTLLAKYPVPQLVHGAGGMDVYKDHFYLVGGLPEGYVENYVYEFDHEFNFIKRHVIESGYTRLGIQTACFADGFWWFGCYGNPKVMIKTDQSFDFIAKYEVDPSLGIETIGPDQFLIGKRYKSDKERGQLVKARPDSVKGLLFLDNSSE